MKKLLFTILMFMSVGAHASTVLEVDHNEVTTYTDGSIAVPPVSYAYSINSCKGPTEVIVGQNISGGVVTSSFDITSLSSGQYSVFVWGIDGNGQAGQCASALFTVGPKELSAPTGVQTTVKIRIP